MKNIEVKSEGINHSAIDLGEFDNLMDYSYFHPKLKQEIKGKVFIGEALKTTGEEISFMLLPPGTEIPFFHKHRHHEEIYIVIKGTGQFQVDENIINIAEGSIIRVAPEGKRTLRNNSSNPMIYMCIQSTYCSLLNHGIADGYRVDDKISWS